MLDDTNAVETTDTTGAANETNESVPVVVKEKRTRLSPRVKAFDEVISMLGEHISDLQEERKEAGDQQHEMILISQIELLSDIMNKVKSMSDEGVAKPTYTGRHYIKVDADGNRSAFNSNVAPLARTHGLGTRTNAASILGPFRFVHGVEYRLAHPEVECPVVF